MSATDQPKSVVSVVKTDVQFEVWQDDCLVASADSLSDAQHYSVIYGQDGPVQEVTAVTHRVPGFSIVSTALAAAPLPQGGEDIREAAQAVVDRWDSPLWKYVEPTAHVIARLRQALAASTPVGGWEPIDALPEAMKDGVTRFLVSYTDGVVRACRWLDNSKTDWPWKGVSPTEQIPMRADARMTHWMPLPPPPSVSIDNGSRPQEAVPGEQAARPVVEPTEAMCDAARGLIMMDRFGLPSAKTPLSECARSGFYGEHWAHILDDDERDYGHRLPKGHLASLIWRAMESARRPQPADGCSSNEGAE